MPARLEIEVKLRVDDAATARTLLRLHGFRCRKRRALESNVVWDNPEGKLQKRGVLVRLRQTGRGRPVLTIKGPRRRLRGVRARPEEETQLRNWEAGELLLRGMGYRPCFRYEKFRSIYSRKGGKDKGHICLDETPIGVFLELEGGRIWIRRTIGELGFDPDRAITASYADLFSRWNRKHHSRHRHMVFGHSG